MSRISLVSQSPEKALCDDAFIKETVAELRESLERDQSEEVLRVLESPFGAKLRSFRLWFQRIEFPKYNISTTSDPGLALNAHDLINSLGGRLTNEEAALLRPVPKWKYLKPILPDLTDKTILDVGSSNGFFTMKFAEAGARLATGVECLDSSHRAAIWAAGELGVGNVQFLNTDMMLDLTLPRHDIVFMTAVHIHFVTLFFGLLRAVNLARETVIIDAGGLPPTGVHLNLSVQENPETGNILSHAWHISPELMLEFMKLIGVEPHRVTRYIPPWKNHIVYVIDVSDVPSYRKVKHYPKYIQSFLDLNFKMG